jgi:hypothetical protein
MLSSRSILYNLAFIIYKPLVRYGKDNIRERAAGYASREDRGGQASLSKGCDEANLD